MKLINPATEESKEITETPIEKIQEMTQAAHSAALQWARTPVEKRAQILAGLAPLLKNKRAALAQTITENMGKPLHKSLSEIDLTIQYVQFFSEKAPQWLAPEKIEQGHIQFDPVGTVGVISPWNYPYSTAFLALLPALLSGNSILFKPSEQTAQTGEDIRDLFAELEWFPKNLLQVIIGGKLHGKELVKQPVQMIAFTGSTAAGKDIMRQSADSLKKLILELGGMDAAIVLQDCDVAETANAIVQRNAINTGQVCCSIKRVYVEAPIYDAFVKEAKQASKEITLGDPAKNVDMGPMVASFQREKVEAIVEDAKRKGAEILTGGRRLDRKGYFYPSTVLTDVSHDMKVMQEEPFGPLLPIVKVESWKEGVEWANRSPYGLTGSVWTKDHEKAIMVASQLQVGVAGINTHGAGPVGTPWGGVKESGLGRMKSKQGMREFTNTKLVLF